MSSGPPHFTYLPAPHERAYYGRLFQTADEERTGNIGGNQAVSFFMKSKVPIALLKDIWTAADQPPTNALDPHKFAVAIRLIQCEQNGITLSTIRSPDLQQGLPPNLRPAWFEGVNPPAAAATGPPPAAAATGPPPAAPHRPDASSVAPSVTGGPPPPPPANYQLAVQDPYLITPTEQSRYEQLFPEYTLQDPQKQYMQGSEAVTLFQKSGLSQAILAQIWNMVDSDPVDNQLDLVEFVLAMHLIVCISKKNLPVPAALPLSLKQFKQQQKQQQHPPSHITMNGGGPVPLAAPEPAAQMPPAPMAPPAVSVPTMMSSPARSMAPTVLASPPAAASAFSGLPGPPPLSKTGGMSISDAFEGLDAVGATGSGGLGSHFGGGGDTGSISSYRAATPVPAVASPKITTIHEVAAPATTIPEPHPPKEFVASYDLGDNHVELKKLREALQKLQAENISLKATMGNLSVEEQDVQRELNATVAEVTKLSNDLTKIRAQVLASKSRLLEATAELKAAKDKTVVLKDLISDATATKQAMDEAHESIENANEVLARSAGVTGGAVAAAPAPMPDTDFFGGWGDDDTGAVNAPLPGLGSGLYTATTSSAEDISQPYQPPPPAVSQPPAVASAPAPTLSYSANLEPPPSMNMYNGGGYTGGGHNRDVSGNDFGEVMGSGAAFQIPTPSSMFPQSYGSSGYGSSIGAPSTYDSIPQATSLKEVEDLKSKSKEADDLARDAEASRKQLVAQLEELRKLADDAESKVRAASDKPVKKKGILGRGGPQKKDQKEIDRLMMDARDKKEAMLQAQAQVKDAEALVTATKREAERLNKEAEDAQMSVAAAASMQDHSKLVSPQPQYEAPMGGGGGGGFMSMPVYDNPGTSGIDYSNPFE